jgi:Tol biopolymer transport system component
MKTIYNLLIVIIIASSQVNAQKNIGIFDQAVDVGAPKLAGSSSYDIRAQAYQLKGSGYNIWFGRDEFQFLHKKIKGDFILTANFKFIGSGTDPHRKVGWMVRNTTDDNSAHISATLHGDGLTVMQWRPLQGSYMRDPEDEIFSIKKNPGIIQLERQGDKIIMRIANIGEPLQVVGEHDEINFPDEVLAGLFICSHHESVIEEAIVWNVRIDRTVPEGYDGYKDGFIGSRMETMDVQTGIRKVIYESSSRFEAPNWMPDGKSLLFNADGSLFTIPITGGTPRKLNTDFADKNNNDHAISFDHQWLAISHHRQGLPGGGSSIYILPLAGGTPRLLTEKTPSYFHGWSPDGKFVTYVAQREGIGYDIYKIAVKGGQEIKLTSTPKGAHVDGPEYSPDGKYIYYNGSTTGTMQLWRMKPDGTMQEQITFDQYNNWFPHPSPNGKWIAFISFEPTIEANDHPLYKRVMLRVMPTAGGAPRVIGYLYGGQGTINVPSWSPDSKFLAFVSNSVE